MSMKNTIINQAEIVEVNGMSNPMASRISITPVIKTISIFNGMIDGIIEAIPLVKTK